MELKSYDDAMMVEMTETFGADNPAVLLAQLVLKGLPEDGSLSMDWPKFLAAAAHCSEPVSESEFVDRMMNDAGEYAAEILSG